MDDGRKESQSFAPPFVILTSAIFSPSFLNVFASVLVAVSLKLAA